MYSDGMGLFNDGSFTVAGGGAIFVDGEAITQGNRYEVVDFDGEAGVEVDVGDVVIVLRVNKFSEGFTVDVVEFVAVVSEAVAGGNA